MSSRRPRKKGCRTFPSADVARYSISARSCGSNHEGLSRTRKGARAPFTLFEARSINFAIVVYVIICSSMLDLH
jgi:hypothetical protein